MALFLLESCHLLGFCAGEIIPNVMRFVAYCKNKGGVAIFVLLMSSFWPYFTYWGPHYLRRNAMIKVYQSEPMYQIDPHGDIADSAMAGGHAVSWGLARMWFWAVSIFLFAKYLCDHLFHPFVHKHITQSGIILFILHYVFVPPYVKALYGSGMHDPVALLYTTIILTFATCFVIYGLIVSNEYTSALFGVISVKPTTQ